MDKTQILNEIFSNDPLWLLEIKQKSKIISTDERLLTSFEEINSFYEVHNCEPKKTTGNERMLFSRLKWIRENPKKIKALKQYDRFNLLNETKKEIEINSIDDIFNSDDLGIFESVDEKKDIFKIVNVPEVESDRADPDFVAQRIVCEDFYKYENLFLKCQDDLRSKRRLLVPSVEKDLKEWTFCVLDWVLLYIAKIWKEERWNSWKINRRTLLIFENWTQSNMLLRSLWKRLRDSWKMLTELTDEDTLFTDITNEDNESWFIYILKSLSNDDRISTKRNLYKIGFSTTPVEQRIINAENDPTYLMAKVKIVETFKVFNVNPHKLEQLIHKFFSESCLNIDIIDSKWLRTNPREWFIVPLNIIENVINLIISWDIVKYKYDSNKELIVEK